MGQHPSPRSGHGTAVIEDNLYVFGGRKRDNTLYSLNTISCEWVFIPIAESSGSLPQSRAGMSMFHFGSNIYVFGGYNQHYNTTSKDFKVFSTETHCWSELSKPG